MAVTLLAPDVVLLPVRRALLDEAVRDAQEILRRADQQAADLQRDAEQEADCVVAQARAAAQAAADQLTAASSAAADRAGRALVLRAQRAAYEGLVTKLRARLVGLPADPRYPALRARLEELARARLGPTATVTPDPSGGVIADAGGRHVDLSLPALAEIWLTELPSTSARLWST